MSHRLHSLRILSETDPDGGVWRNLYEPRTGVLLESEDPLRQKTRYEWETPFGPKKVTGSGGDE
ncbi:MAG: hypothetical protein LBF51_02165, partial [Zoogloeaceae bacterium]|nr:hypothetical protein [Zoogloeaceae bacterium]